MAIALAAAATLAAGCGGGDDDGGGESVTPEQRVERCLSKQPDATESDCEQWEKDGQLGDDGTHAGHQG